MLYCTVRSARILHSHLKTCIAIWQQSAVCRNNQFNYEIPTLKVEWNIQLHYRWWISTRFEFIDEIRQGNEIMNELEFYLPSEFKKISKYHQKNGMNTSLFKENSYLSAVEMKQNNKISSKGYRRKKACNRIRNNIPSISDSLEVSPSCPVPSNRKSWSWGSSSNKMLQMSLAFLVILQVLLSTQLAYAQYQQPQVQTDEVWNTADYYKREHSLSKPYQGKYFLMLY